MTSELNDQNDLNEYSLQVFNEEAPAVSLARSFIESQNIHDPDQGRRKDLRHLISYAIDKEPKEIDDAISWDATTSRIYVHIADPTMMFSDPRTEPILEQVMRRTQSIYWGSNTRPMFPMPLVKERFSMDGAAFAGEVLTVSFIISKEGEIVEGATAIETAIISRPQFLNFPEAKERIEKAMEDSSTDDLLELYKKAILRVQERAEDQFFVDVGQLKEGGRTSVESMVEEMMITANTITALYCRENGIPVIFKSQSLDENKIQQDQLPLVDSTTASCHDGMGLECYLQMTSPLRRSGDVVVHLQVKAHLRSAALPFSKREIDEYILESAEMKKNVKQFSKAMRKRAKRESKDRSAAASPSI